VFLANLFDQVCEELRFYVPKFVGDQHVGDFGELVRELFHSGSGDVRHSISTHWSGLRTLRNQKSVR
jgi:hypothetical protein